MRHETSHMYTIKSLCFYFVLRTLLYSYCFAFFFFYTHQIFFPMFKHISGSSCKRVSKVVGKVPWEETFHLILFHLHLQLFGGTASGSVFSAENFPPKMRLCFDLLEIYKGINMHVDKREHTDKIHLDFLKP